MKEEFKFSALWLSLICVIVYLFETRFSFIVQDFAPSSNEFLAKPWILLTYIFIHANVKHLFFNLFALVLFGSILELIIGYKKFLIVFFLSGIISGIGGLFFYNSMIGASGAIFGILGVLGAIRPKAVVWVWGVPMYMIFALAFWVVLNFLGIFSPENVAYISHLFGLFFGIIIGMKLRREYGIKSKKSEEEIHISEEEIEKWEDKYLRR